MKLLQKKRQSDWPRETCASENWIIWWKVISPVLAVFVNVCYVVKSSDQGERECHLENCFILPVALPKWQDFKGFCCQFHQNLSGVLMLKHLWNNCTFIAWNLTMWAKWVIFITSNWKFEGTTPIYFPWDLVPHGPKIILNVWQLLLLFLNKYSRLSKSL